MRGGMVAVWQGSCRPQQSSQPPGQRDTYILPHALPPWPYRITAACCCPCSCCSPWRHARPPPPTARASRSPRWVGDQLHRIRGLSTYAAYLSTWRTNGVLVHACCASVCSRATCTAPPPPRRSGRVWRTTLSNLLMRGKRRCNALRIINGRLRHGGRRWLRQGSRWRTWMMASLRRRPAWMPAWMIMWRRRRFPGWRLSPCCFCSSSTARPCAAGSSACSSGAASRMVCGNGCPAPPPLPPGQHHLARSSRLSTATLGRQTPRSHEG